MLSIEQARDEAAGREGQLSIGSLMIAGRESKVFRAMKSLPKAGTVSRVYTMSLAARLPNVEPDLDTIMSDTGYDRKNVCEALETLYTLLGRATGHPPLHLGSEILLGSVVVVQKFR